MVASIHRSAWKGNSRKFAGTEFCEVHPTFEGCWLSVSSLMECRRTAESIIYIIMDLRNNRFHARLLDAVGQAVIAADPQGTVIYWNRAAQELYGWSAEEAMGHPIMEV